MKEICKSANIGNHIRGAIIGYFGVNYKGDSMFQNIQIFLIFEYSDKVTALLCYKIDVCVNVHQTNTNEYRS